MALDQNTTVRIVMRERVKVFAYIWSIVRDEHLAEDVFQEVAMLVLEKREELRDPEALPVWMRRTARHRAMQALRRQARRPRPLDEAVLDRLEATWDRYDHDQASDRVEALRECLAKLTPRAQQVMKLRYADGLSGQELARSTGRKLESVYMALSRIHNRLADCVRRRLAEGMEGVRGVGRGRG